MQKTYKFQLEDVIELPNWTDLYPEYKFTIFKTCFLSTKKNSHELDISYDVLKEHAKSILGTFLVAKIDYGDATTHEQDEVPWGYFPITQEIEFVEDNDILKAYAYAVVSKRYGQQLNDIFEFDNLRNASVEMTVETLEDNEHNVISFDIWGLTVLGKMVKGSCPDADIEMVRFSKDDAEKYFESKKEDIGVTYKVDKSKEAMSDTPWGDVDKTELRNKIMEADNRDSIVKDVYIVVEDGWEDAPSEHLKYPVMELKDDTLVYNRNALSSALGYAKANDEQSVVDKVEKIYKSLDLEDSDGKEEKEMSEIVFAAVDIGDMWGKLWDALHAKYPDGDYGSVYRVEAIYEESNKKFALIRRKDEDTLYRLDFSLTEEGLTLSDEIVKVDIEIVETDEVRKFAEPEDCKKYKEFEDDLDDHDDEHPDDCQCEDCKMKRMQSDIDDRDNIIMEKDKVIKELQDELEVLRKFKCDIEEKEKMSKVESIMEEIKDYVDDGQYNDFRDKGIACACEDIDGWANECKAFCFSKTKKNTKKNNDLLVWSYPQNGKQHKSIWD
ncbi:MAG: hypothetical protein IJA72_01100 [Clostridia bacterium]|nr:hypothetical protein [Clostridia bacterium]